MTLSLQNSKKWTLIFKAYTQKVEKSGYKEILGIDRNQEETESGYQLKNYKWAVGGVQSHWQIS